MHRERDRVTITRNGRPVAVLISVDELDSIEETLDVLSDPEEVAAIREGEAEIARGEFCTAEDLKRDDVKRLPAGVAEAIVEFMTWTLVEHPRGVGKPLTVPFDRQWSARRGEYRVIYRIDDEAHVVTVTRANRSRAAP